MTELPATFGKYYLTEKLATGGMAEIYLAKLIGPGGFEKPLVIKQIHPKLSGQRRFVDLFVAEAKTLVALTHGNIVPVYELGVVDDTYFIAMEYIDGPTLYRLTETMAGRGASMEPALAAWITARILEGLDYAHRKGEGVIHRDLSPRNVMMSRDGEVKLVDFGIAVTLGDAGEAGGPEAAPTGSFPYMSPEQVRREPLTGQTDLFSAGVLCWEMLVGRRLFARADPDATLAAVTGAEIPVPSSQRADVPAKLDEVVMRALERDRAARWPDAREMLAAIHRYLYALDATPGPREVAALVAQFCPASTRRLPTHLEAVAHEAAAYEPPAGGGPVTVPAGAPAADAPTPGPQTKVMPREPAAAGPQTAVLPRDPGAAPRGKKQRHQTFATNVELRDVLERAGSPEEVEAPRDEGEPAAATGAERATPEPAGDAASAGQPRAAAPAGDEAASAAEPGAAAPAGDDEAAPRPAGDASGPKEPAGRHGRAAAERGDRPPPRLPGRRPPAQSMLVLAGLGAIALGIVAVYMFFQGRNAVLHGESTAMPPIVAPALDARPADATARDASPPADAALPLDAAAPVAAPPDAPRHPPPIDAGRRRPRDAVARVRRHPDAARPAARATLAVGANPWGEVYIDGKHVGRAPEHFPVPAGHHVVEIVLPIGTPPRRQRFELDLAAGETRSLLADFSHP